MTELRGTAALSIFAAISGAAFAAALPASIPRHPAAPQEHLGGDYLGSKACRSCHPSEHASFQNTFHRSMTRHADELSWDAEASPKLPTNFQLYGREFKLQKRPADGSIRYLGPDLHQIGRGLLQVSREPDTSALWKRQKSLEVFRAAPQVERDLVLVTGSHHYLAFWIEGGEDSELRQFPFVYLLDEARFLPRKNAFLQPPDALPVVARWNANCIQCHSVAGRPTQSEGNDPKTGHFWERYDTSVVEPGIACEACHGPGREHASYYRNPLHRAEARDNTAPQHIFVPRPEEGAKASEACGQCHSYFVPTHPDQWWESGFAESFQAGDSLAASRTVLRAPAPEREESNAADSIDRDLSTIFWEDGSIIVGGREYNGLTESPCFERGHGERRLACTSCHSMHEGNPDKQIAPEKEGDKMCTSCHEDIAQEHSRHRPDSPGARCVNCHMPRTSYALLHGIPNHKIASPSMKMERPPNACSLCHVDRSASWISDKLADFGLSPLDASSSAASPSALPLAVERALSGNAAERALYAYALGTEEVAATASSTIADLLLPRLEKDPYAAVRLIAERAEKKIEATRAAGARVPGAPNSSLPPLSAQQLSHLEEMRDKTPITVSE